MDLLYSVGRYQICS